jgi:uncharacterized protein
METAVKMARVYLHEADHGRRNSLVREILVILRDSRRVQNVTVFRGVAGCDDHGEVHASDMLRVMVNLPEAIEFFDAPERVEDALRLLKDLVPEGRIVTWDAMRR